MAKAEEQTSAAAAVSSKSNKRARTAPAGSRLRKPYIIMPRTGLAQTVAFGLCCVVASASITAFLLSRHYAPQQTRLSGQVQSLQQQLQAMESLAGLEASLSLPLDAPATQPPAPANGAAAPAAVADSSTSLKVRPSSAALPSPRLTNPPGSAEQPPPRAQPPMTPRPADQAPATATRPPTLPGGGTFTPRAGGRNIESPAASNPAPPQSAFASTGAVVPATDPVDAATVANRLVAVPAARAGVARLEPGAVVMVSGKRVAVGERFEYGEILVSVDPPRGKVVTNARTLVLVDL